MALKKEMLVLVFTDTQGRRQTVRTSREGDELEQLIRNIVTNRGWTFETAYIG